MVATSQARNSVRCQAARDEGSSGDPGLGQHEAGGERQRAGQVGEAFHLLLHAVALRAPGEADQRHLLERGALHVLVDRDALGLVELGAAFRQQLARCAAPAG